MTSTAQMPSETREAGSTRRPNILLLHIDDLGWSDLGCYGSTFYETPRLDALARASCSFTEAYAASPVCSPSRAALMTGKVPARVGITQWIGGSGVAALSDVPYHHDLPRNEYTLPRALRDGGYTTWHVGKWHLGAGTSGPLAHGFDVNIGGGHRGSPNTYFAPWGIEDLPESDPGTYLTDALTDHVLALIREHDGERPFFLHLAQYAVHAPIQAPEELVAKYRRKAQALGLDRVDPFEVGERKPMWGQEHQRVIRRTVQSDPAYAAMVENLDTNVGRVLDELREQGLAEDTIVVFTSDNGGLSTAEGSPTSCAPLAEGKGWTEEGGVRVPLILRAPGVTTPGTTARVVANGPDLYPTLLDLVGLPLVPVQHVDGVSLRPWLAQTDPLDDRGPVFWHYPHYSNQGGRPSAAVRQGRYKLIRFFEDESAELYDLETDIGERRDLASELPTVRDELLSALAAHLDEVGALIPRTNPWPRPFD
ncbi:sulfatase [Brachybacterium sp. YJGR34]|uniref:sulfatase n=1 Tax=Brachybacterium sp. YJGR34 TaxID=2059911 RepID=UPI001E2C3CBE|nr:sulfatase [Brachybacterium sp. YJGR34]